LNKFNRTKLLIGNKGIQALRNSKVMVCGLGGVGSYASEALCRAGIGNLVLVDFDKIKLSNFNRQLYALDDTLGSFKIDEAKKRLSKINSDCIIETKKIFIDSKNSEHILDESITAVVDAIDSVSPKVSLISSCVKKNIFLVSCFGSALRVDPLLVRVDDISQTKICPLARFIRKKLHKRGIYKGVTCVYSIEPPKTNLYEEEPESDDYQKGRIRKPLGSISYMPGIFGLIASYVIIKHILGFRP